MPFLQKIQAMDEKSLQGEFENLLPELENRVAKAVELFNQGFNCSQSVVAAFADLYDFSRDQALRMSASFGGGIGRMRQTCGAACGLFLLAGLETGTTDSSDKEGKNRNYAQVRKFADDFQAINGSLICAELLASEKQPELLSPSKPMHFHYAKKHCDRMVESAARLFAHYLICRRIADKAPQAFCPQSPK